jgi:hypothetical protein
MKVGAVNDSLSQSYISPVLTLIAQRGPGMYPAASGWVQVARTAPGSKHSAARSTWLTQTG